MIMKTLLISISLFAATLTTNGHCGGCGIGEKEQSQDNTANSCCSGSGSCCSEKMASPDDMKSCDTIEKSSCGTFCCDKTSPTGKNSDSKESFGLSEAATSPAKSTIPLPMMSCCPADE